MTGSTRIRNAVYSAATVLALGFGAAQAFAAPGAPQKDAGASCSGTQINSCYYSCRSRGYMSGICELSSSGYPLCECIGYIQPY